LGHLRRAAFFALSAYDALADFGVETLVSDAKVKARWADEQDVEHHWTSHDRVMVAKALSLDTEAFRNAVLSRVEHQPEALDAVQGTTVIAAGLGSRTTIAGLNLCLNPNRGQQDLVALDPPLTHPLNFGRLLLPLGQGTQAWLGASFDRQPSDDWAEPSLQDREENLDRARNSLPALTFADQGQSWVGLRATTPDHLPLAAWLRPELAVLTGLGSKGFLYAPILAQCLIAEALGFPLPLENWAWQALHPHRFQTRNRFPNEKA
jgi:tRNA 5-methylaminomethyl-2-thiouridine biosynthesis bifunctional protein